ncbi:MAG: transcriptional regulator NrdR [Deltaproteobacteria bacterium]
MKCPFCAYLEDKVIDSRLSQDGCTTRRRRECLKCEKRFTTYERVEETLPLVVKKDGAREPFDRAKVLGGIMKACEKRPVSIEDMERAVGRLEMRLLEGADKEVASSSVGEAVMDEIKRLDEVAYVRFASVYREFRDINEFMSELKDILDNKKRER